MLQCHKCKVSIDADESYEHAGQVVCEDCYMDAMNPPKACDPWAVHTAKSSSKQDPQLTKIQQDILSLLEKEGPLKAVEVMKRLEISEDEFKRAFATLRHMELARGFKEGEQVYYTLFSS